MNGMHGTHESPLVWLSILIAICASYTALTLAGRVAAARGRARLAWLLGGSVAMGSGIWSMHFVAMLAFHLPVAIGYDVPLVALSFLAAVGASAFALFVASRATVGIATPARRRMCLGLAVVTMHYTGMAAVRVPAQLDLRSARSSSRRWRSRSPRRPSRSWLFLWLRNDNTRRGAVASRGRRRRHGPRDRRHALHGDGRGAFHAMSAQSRRAPASGSLARRASLFPS